MSHPLREVYDRLYARFGPQQWWPGETPFEVLVGAVLTQNTSWKNVEKALSNLHEDGLLEPRRLYELAREELAELIRPAGYYRVKAKRLGNLLDFVFDRYDGSLEAMFSVDVATLREQLLGVNGIGPETADSIILYAAARPVFVIDAYTRRVFGRHRLVAADDPYDRLQRQLHHALPPDAGLFNEYHALLVRVGKENCRKGQPRCGGCPLEPFLPAGGAVV